MESSSSVQAGSCNGNLRVSDSATGQWQVHFFSMPVYGNGIWRGGKEGDTLVLRQPQKAPGTDFDGVSRLTLSNISERGFDWAGEPLAAIDGDVAKRLLVKQGIDANCHGDPAEPGQESVNCTTGGSNQRRGVRASVKNMARQKAITNWGMNASPNVFDMLP